MDYSVKIPKNNIEDIIALSSMQELMLFNYLRNQSDSAYHELLRLDVRGEINDVFFKKAWLNVISTYPTLRTCFRWKGLKKPIQLILKELSPDIRVFDLTNLNEEIKENENDKIIESNCKKIFDLENVPFRIVLIKYDDNLNHLYIMNHHILMDGWSTRIVISRFFKDYYKLLAQLDNQVEKEQSFKCYVKYLQNQPEAELVKYWSNYLKDYNHIARVEPDFLENLSVKISKDKEYILEFSETLSEQINDVVKKEHVSVLSFIHSIWGIMLARINDSNDVVFGSVISDRPSEILNIENCVGLFINTIPERVTIVPGQTFKDLIIKIHNESIKKKDFQSYPLFHIQKLSSLKNNLFDHLIEFNNYPKENLSTLVSGEIKNSNEELRVEKINFSSQNTFNFDILASYDKCLRLILRYNSKIHKESSISFLAKNFKSLINQVVSSFEIPINSLKLDYEFKELKKVSNRESNTNFNF